MATPCGTTLLLPPVITRHRPAAAGSCATSASMRSVPSSAPRWASTRTTSYPAGSRALAWAREAAASTWYPCPASARRISTRTSSVSSTTRTRGPPGPAARRPFAGSAICGPLADPRGQRRHLGPPLHAELGEQRGHVVLDGLLGQEHPLGDLPVRQPFADQIQDAPLLLGQPGQWVVALGPVAHPGHHPAGGLRIKQ